MVRLLVGALVGSVMTAGCSAFGSQPRTYVGQVTMVNARTVCIGGPAASGECFVKDAVTEGLRVNDCVRVTYVPDSQKRGPYRAQKVSDEDAGSHPNACPGQ